MAGQVPAASAPPDQDQAEQPLVFAPNVRPEGIEVAGDVRWRDWRLRKRRPELRERYTPTFPDINPLLEREANARIAAEVNVNVTPFTKRTLKDLLKDRNYRVERLQFLPLQATYDRVDATWAEINPRTSRLQEDLDTLPAFFFEELTSSLFARVWDFAATTFGQQPAFDPRSNAQKEADFTRQLQDTDWTGHFLQHLPPDFIRCVSEIARGDYRNRGWKDYDPHGYEHLFLDRDQRIHLCTAVIAKLLQEQCFDSLLFGARKIERDALRKTDVAQEDIANGYARKMSRTSSVPKYLTRDLFTVNFWPEVGRVATGILQLLLPVINFVGELEPDAGALPLTEVYQQLHNIVAEAGWIANGLARTRSCFWIEFPQPGQLWDVRQEHVTDVVWKASKAITDENDAFDLESAMRTWRRTRMPVYDALADPKPTLRQWSRNIYELDNPKPRQVRRTAKVQISMWPFFERSYPYKQELVSGDYNFGESTTTFQKAQVVYYAGDDTDAGEQQEDYTLKQYLEDYKRKNAIFWGPRAWISWPIIVVLLLFALYFSGPSICAGYDEVRHSHWGLPDHLIPKWTWPTWDWPRNGWQRIRRDGQPHAPLRSRTSSTRPSKSSTRPSRSSTRSSKSSTRSSKSSTRSSKSSTRPLESPSHRSPTTSHPTTSKDASTISSQSTETTSSYRRRLKPPVYTSDVYSTRTITKTRPWTTTRLPGAHEPEDRIDRQASVTTIPSSWTSTGKQGSATTVPTSRTSTGRSSKQTSKPPPKKPSIKPSQDSPSTTVLPDTIGAPEPTEEPSPVLTPSGPPDASSTDEETIAEPPASPRPTTSSSSFWRGLFSRNDAVKEVERGSPVVPEQVDELYEDDTGSDEPILDTTKYDDDETAARESYFGKTVEDVGVDSEVNKVYNEHTIFDGPPSMKTKSVDDETAAREWGFTRMKVDVGSDPVTTGNIEHISSVLREAKDDSSKIHKTTSWPGLLSWISSAWRAPDGTSGDERLPLPSFTTEMPPDVVFTDPASPGVTLNMQEGFWVNIHPLGFEYNCWVRSRTAECTSTVWTTVTAEPTAKPKVTESPWKPTI